MKRTEFLSSPPNLARWLGKRTEGAGALPPNAQSGFAGKITLRHSRIHQRWSGSCKQRIDRCAVGSSHEKGDLPRSIAFAGRRETPDNSRAVSPVPPAPAIANLASIREIGSLPVQIGRCPRGWWNSCRCWRATARPTFGSL